MRNPFQYGCVVSGESFCNRTQEAIDLRRSVENAEKRFVYSERRLGKTSLIRKVLAELPEQEYMTVYIDLWPTDGETSFVLSCAKAFTEAMASNTDKLLHIAKTFFGRLVPSITSNDEGRAVISFGFDQKRPDMPLLEEVLAMPAKAAEKEGKRMVVVFDEFQQILEYESDTVERLLRSSIQHQTDVAYIFCGSRKHLIREMFMDSQRPLYRSGAHYPIGADRGITLADVHRGKVRNHRQEDQRGNHFRHLPTYRRASLLHPAPLPSDMGIVRRGRRGLPGSNRESHGAFARSRKLCLYEPVGFIVTECQTAA